jgi:hypothetical protein
MSPNEADLRAALHAGEGDPLDPETVLSAARAARSQRRVRAASAAGAALLVGAIGTGIGLADLHSSTNPAAAGASSRNAGSNANEPSSSAQALYGSTAPAPAQRALGTLTCPKTPAHYLLPGGGGTGQFGGNSPLFSGPVAAMKLCMYPANGAATPRTFVLEGGDAQSVANSLNAAPTSVSQRMCPDVMPEDEFTFEMLAVTADGAKLRPVVAQPGCRGQVTNGTAVRFGWSAPRSFTSHATPQPTR